MEIQISRCLDLRYKSKNNTFPVCIRFYYNRRYDYIKTGVFLTQAEYEDLYSSKIKSTLKPLLKAMKNIGMETGRISASDGVPVTDLGFKSQADFKRVYTAAV